MSILTRKKIKELMASGLIKIGNFEPANLGTNSYDLTLGNDFWLVKWKPIDKLSWLKSILQRFGYFKGKKLHKPTFQYIHYEDGESVPICNGNTLLARPKELVGTGDGIVVKMKGKSTTRRTGMTVCDDAGLGDLLFGFDNVGGVWVSEVTGHVGAWWQPYPYLTVGMPYCQLVFEEATEDDSTYTGQYGGDWGNQNIPPHMMLPKIYRSEKYTVGYDWSRCK